jgi:hypothetical protein
MYTWGPILLLALIPAWWYPSRTLVLPRRERMFVVVSWVVFCCSRRESVFTVAVQTAASVTSCRSCHFFSSPWPITGFGGLARQGRAGGRRRPPFVGADRLPEPVLQSWKMFWAEGPQLPWYRVLTLTSGAENPYLGTWWVPTMILAATLALAAGIWRYGSRLEMTNGVR